MPEMFTVFTNLQQQKNMVLLNSYYKGAE